jgi:hypothetical protein
MYMIWFYELHIFNTLLLIFHLIEVYSMKKDCINFVLV